MDLTKDMLDFTRKLEGGEGEMEVPPEEKLMATSSNEFSMFAEQGNAEEESLLMSMQQEKNSNETEPLIKMPLEVVQKPTTPQLIENLGAPSSSSAAKALQSGGDISPPPRPLTSSEVVGFSTALDDPEMQLDATVALNKSRSLPASPNHLNATHITDLFGFAAMKSSKITTAAPATHSNSLETTTSMTIPRIIPNMTPKSLAAKGLPKFPASDARNSQQFCLRWNNYQSNLTNVFDELLQNESFVDVTLACEGHSIKAHKMILSACSPYFQALFYDNPCQHPIVIMRDVRWQELKALMEFMYKGEINVSQDQINPLLKVAEMLKIRGLAEVSSSGGARAGGVGASLLGSHERSMGFEDDPEDMEDEEEALVNDLEEDAEDSPTNAAKRPRIQVSQKLVSPLNMNLGEQRMRKRSRDGMFIEDERILETSLNARNRSRSRSRSPQARDKEAAASINPVAMTTSTIVRNPFASPNPTQGSTQNSSGSTANAPTQASSSVNSTSATSISSAAVAAAAAASPNVVALPYRSLERSCSPPMMTPPQARAQSSVSNTTPSALPSPSSNSSAGPSGTVPPSISLHSHPAAAAVAAAALANPHHPHHHAAAAAQQLAAQHQQLQAAAHSHAMASALGASLAAAAAGATPATNPAGSTSAHHDDMEIKPEIAEMIREEERAKMIESGHPWMAGATTSSVTDSYQYQLQSMWQKCWNTNQQNLVQQLRFRERGPLKSWRPEAMAEAIFSVLKEGLSLSQAARKYDIPYPTFVLYANRVHNMLGPSLDGGTDPRPKARGRPQRILLGMWPEDLIRSVIKAVVFRDYREIKDEMGGLPFANGQAHAAAMFGASSASSATSAANGYHSAAKLAAQSAAIGHQESASPLSSMTENLRRQIMSQQQQSPLNQSMNIYKAPAYVQRSEIEDPLTAVANKQHTAATTSAASGDRRSAENLPDLSALGLMGLPGLNVIPTGGGAGSAGAGVSSRSNNHLHSNAAAAFSRDLERERERERNRERDREHRERERERDRERERAERERERELKDAMQARQYGNQSRGSAGVSSDLQKPSGTSSPYAHAHMKNKDHLTNYAYNKRFLDNLPPGIDFEAIANGLLQKTAANKSPRFEDFFPGPDMSELIANAEAAAASAPFPAQREYNLMKIKLEHQATEVQHED
ncbi:protein bric-a-brac 2 isoform X2 [Stomoxys calcitrans]|uniref:protein bric-a-brac 2 isoform X2 n=1 Tax=Stomoxys calcitrans TaxID=35570 RepID=UPI0027E2A595|nr:protein bric-a-brac 2 isoform X2 [Stomoxys calcitrans]